jgi:hypothetical protein
VGILAVIALLGPIYWHMLAGPASRLQAHEGGHVYQRLIAAAEQAKSINASELPLDELRTESAVRGKQLEALYSEVLATLEETGGVPLDLSAARADYTARELPNVQLVRSLVRAWDNQARHLADAGRFDESLQYALASVHAASTFSRGGLFFHSVFGNGVEGVGIRRISDISKDVSPPAARKLLATLKALDSGREPVEVALARQNAWDYEAFGWRLRLASALSAVTGRKFVSPDDFEGKLRGSVDRRDVAVRLLIADLAIRLFESEQGRLPRGLGELSGEYLSAPPLDPFSGQPLIYRLDQGTYQLYSIGPDRRDDHGHTGRWSQTLSQHGWDVSLDGINQ